MHLVDLSGVEQEQIQCASNAVHGELKQELSRVSQWHSEEAVNW